METGVTRGNKGNIGEQGVTGGRGVTRGNSGNRGDSR